MVGVAPKAIALDLSSRGPSNQASHACRAMATASATLFIVVMVPLPVLSLL